MKRERYGNPTNQAEDFMGMEIFAFPLVEHSGYTCGSGASVLGFKPLAKCVPLRKIPSKLQLPTLDSKMGNEHLSQTRSMGGREDVSEL